MSQYRVYGTNREVGAIGFPEEFWVDVEATDPGKADELARAARYAAGFEHVHIRTIAKLAPAKPQDAS